MLELKGVCFHRYNYAPRGFVEEGIERRIRQGIGGPTYLEPKAEIMGHLHLAKNIELKTGQIHPMRFGDQTWKVQITKKSALHPGPFESERMVQDDPNVFGYAVFGICTEEVGIKA